MEIGLKPIKTGKYLGYHIEINIKLPLTLALTLLVLASSSSFASPVGASDSLNLNLPIVSSSSSQSTEEYYKPSPGTAIVAIRKEGAFGFGHIGVAFQNAKGTWTAGAIENANDRWVKEFNTQGRLLEI
jgi:hypothetical protein